MLRHCPGDVTPGVEVSSKYIGIAAAHLGFYDPVFGGFGYYVPLIYANKAGLNTVMYIQNGGLECSSLELWFKAQDDCLRARICDVATLAPGETYQFDASDCVGPDWQGSAWIRASEWMGVAVDIYGRDILMTYIGEPAPYSYNLLDDKGNPKVVASPETGEKIAYGPLIYSEYQGWDTGVQVMNLSQVVNAKIKVYFLDRSGDVITTLVDWVCPRGSQTFFLPIVADLPGSWVGSVRIESQVWWTPGTNEVEAPDIVGVATLMKYGDVARTETCLLYTSASERRTFTTGTGGPEGDHIATIADDFNLTGGPWSITEMRACMFQNTSTEAEAWIYNTTGTAPVLPVTDVLVGHSTAGGTDLQSIVFVDNGTRCRTAFGYPGREFEFSPASTGVTFSLPAGSYWLAVVGGAAAGGAGGGRAFRAQSTSSSPPAGSGYALEAQWGSAVFGAAYWLSLIHI